MKQRNLARDILLLMLFNIIALGLFAQIKGVKEVTSISPRKVNGNQLLGELIGCSNEYVLERDSKYQSIYTSPDRFLRLSFSLEDSLVNVFENTKCTQVIGSFKKCYQVSENDFVIEGANRFSLDPNDYFSKKIKSIASFKKKDNQVKFDIKVLEDDEFSSSKVVAISFYKIYWIYVGRQKRTLNIDDFARDYCNKRVYVSNVEVELENVHQVHKRNKIPIGLTVDFASENLHLNFTNKNIKIRREDEKLLMYNWSSKEQRYIKVFMLKYECVRSIYL